MFSKTLEDSRKTFEYPLENARYGDKDIQKKIVSKLFWNWGEIYFKSEIKSKSNRKTNQVNFRT